MKSEPASLGVKGTILPIRQESSGPVQGDTFQSQNSFSEHLHSAEARQSKRKAIEGIKEDVEIDSEGRSFKLSLAKNRPVGKGLNPKICADQFHFTPLRNVLPGFSALTTIEPSPTISSAPEVPVCSEFAVSKSTKNESRIADKATEDAEPPNETLKPLQVFIEQSILSTPPVLLLPNPTPTPGDGTNFGPFDSPTDGEGPKVEVPNPDLGVRHAENNEYAQVVGNPEQEERGRPIERQEEGSGSRIEPFPEGKVAPPIPSRPPTTTIIDRSANGAAMNAGIPTATPQLRMTKEAEMEDSAGLKLNNLPAPEPEWEAPVMHIQSDVDEARDSRRDIKIDPIIGQVVLNTLSHGEDSAPSNEVLSFRDLPVVERLVQSTLEGVTQVRQRGTDSVSVVLQPDPNTELMLQVQYRDGAMTAELSLGRGDRGLLDLHWDELQRRLSEQGIQLSRGNNSNLAGGGQYDHSQQRDSLPDDDSEWISPETSINKISNNPNLIRRAVSGFETWA